MDTRFEPMFAVAAEIEGVALRERLAQRFEEGCEPVVVGVGPERAEALGSRLDASAPGAIVSPGLAGSLDPDLRPGDIFLIERWVDPQPPHATIVEAHAELTARIAAALRAARLIYASGAATTVDAPLHDPDRRTALHTQAGAQVVEMEGRRWAQIAAAASCPFASVRVISDDAATPLALPRHLLFDLSGRIRWGRWLRALAESGVPDDAERQLERLFRARDEWRRAMAGLEAVADALVADLDR
jgi:nucleoside phosphorylase